MNINVTANRVIASGVVFLLCFFTTNLSSAQIPAQSLSLPQIAVSINTPEDIARYMWRNFIYQKDQRQFGKADQWQSPDQLLSTGQGDCEDFALFAHKLLKIKGYTSFLMNIYGRSYAHTICVFKENGQYHAVDGTKIKKVNAGTLEELIQKIHPFWTKASMVRYFESSNQAKTMKLFIRKK